MFSIFKKSNSRKKISHSWPMIDDSDITAVIDVLKSGYLSNGPQGKKLAEEIALRAQQRHGLAVSSGTTGLHMALLAVGVTAGDEVIMPSYVCLGLAQAARYIGAVPVITDVLPEDGNMDPEFLKRCISPKTRAILVPHMFGTMADMPRILAIAGSIPVIEDCAMSPGAEWAGKPAGSFGVISVFSFYATKMITGGEGGVVATSDHRLAAALEDLREYDKKLDTEIRYNYKMDEMSAALALSQLRKLPRFIERRRQIADRYTQELVDLPLRLPQSIPVKSQIDSGQVDKTHIFYRYVVRTPEAKALREFLAADQIEAGRGVVGGLHRVYGSGGQFPIADEWLDQGVSLPIYPSLTESEQDAVISRVKAYYAKLAA